MKFSNLIRNFLEVRSRKFVVGALVAVFAVVGMFAGGAALAANGNANAAANSERLVTIYDDGTERTILTHADTVAMALKDANIATSAGDDVEPKASAKLTDTSTNINIYRARPVVVADGARQIRVVTAAQSVAGIAQAAGLTLDAADRTNLSRVDDVLAAGGAGLRLNITRAKTVNLTLYGKILNIKTQAKTVAELLKEKNILLSQDDTITPSLDTPIGENLAVEIWRNGTQTVTADEPIAFASETISDATRDKTFREVRTAGANGVASVTYEIEMKNGAEISRREIQRVVVQQPTTEVVVVGTKVAGPAYNPNGTHEEWMRAAGISAENFAYVEFIVQKESGWNPNSRNASSGACGLPQALPCSKLGANWNNPVVALSWMNGYVGRYGGWAGAYAFWQSHHWY